MVTMNGRRMAQRSRVRTGMLVNEDGTMDESVAPADVGSDPAAGDDNTDTGISIEIGLLL